MIEGWDHIYDLLDAADDEENPASLNLIASLDQTKSLLDAYPNCGEAHYLRAYALLLQHWKGFNLAPEALRELDVALQLDPTLYFARFYLITLLYRNFSNYERVYDTFRSMNRDDYILADQEWRYVKAWEYSLCSSVHLGRSEEFKEGLPQMIDDMIRMDADPEEILERPNLVLKILENLRRGDIDKYSSKECHDLMRLIVSEISRLVPGGWIGKDELARIRGYVNGL